MIAEAFVNALKKAILRPDPYWATKFAQETRMTEEDIAAQTVQW